MILPIVSYGSDILLRKTEEVDLFEYQQNQQYQDKIRSIIADMLDTMKAAPGQGLAAPQVNYGFSIFVKEKHVSGETVFINPKVVKFSGVKKLGQEGCLSIPKLYCDVERYSKVTIEYLVPTEKGLERRQKKFTNEEARAIQHEVGHLNGVLITAIVKGKLITVRQGTGFIIEKAEYWLDDFNKGYVEHKYRMLLPDGFIKEPC